MRWRCLRGTALCAIFAHRFHAFFRNAVARSLRDILCADTKTLCLEIFVTKTTAKCRFLFKTEKADAACRIGLVWLRFILHRRANIRCRKQRAGGHGCL